MDEDTENLDKLIDSAEMQVSDMDAALESAEEKRKNLQASDRSKIGKIIIYVYAGTIAGIFLYIIASFVMPYIECNVSCSDIIKNWKEYAEFLADVVTVSVVPIVTLVIGFYFGSEKKNE